MILIIIMITNHTSKHCQPFYVLQQTEDMSGSSIIVIVYNIYIYSVY